MKRQVIAEKLGNPRIRRIGFKKVRPLDIGLMLLWIFLPFSLGYSLLAACLACISRTLSLLGLDDN
jgi:hypothetical protein